MNYWMCWLKVEKKSINSMVLSRALLCFYMFFNDLSRNILIYADNTRVYGCMTLNQDDLSLSTDFSSDLALTAPTGKNCQNQANIVLTSLIRL